MDGRHTVGGKFQAQAQLHTATNLQNTPYEPAAAPLPQNLSNPLIWLTVQKLPNPGVVGSNPAGRTT